MSSLTMEIVNTRPKKNQNGYMIYRAEVADDIKEANPDLSMVEQAKIIGEQWQNLNEKEKEVNRWKNNMLDRNTKGWLKRLKKNMKKK